MSEAPSPGKSMDGTPRATVWLMYRAMVGVGLVCGLLIVSVFQLTKPVIARNQAEALQRAIFQVLPQARGSATFRQVGDAAFEPYTGPGGGETLVYVGYDQAQEMIGFAIEAQGMGYQDVIRILYGYDFDQNAVIGIRVLDSKETPGLGDRIESDPEFLANFVRLDVSLHGDGTRVAHPIVLVKKGKKQNPWEIDAITGATISSRAIADILSRSTQRWVPLLRAHLDDFQKAGDAHAD